MDIFRYGTDAWGRPVILGVSWQLIWVAVGVGVLVILAHAVYRFLRGQEQG